MKIYLDYIFIENFFITVLTLYETKKILDISSNFKRIIIASLIASIYIVIMIFFKIDYMNYLICKILLVQIVVYIAFNCKDIKKLIVNSVKFFMVNIFNIGLIYILSNFINIKVNSVIQKIGIYILTFIIGSYAVKYFCKLLKNKENTEIYNVNIKLFGKTIHYRGFLDTGNTAFCYIYNLPVIFASMSKNIEYKDLRKLTNVNIIVKTINGEKNEKGYLIEEIFIEEINVKKKAIVIFVEEEYFNSDKYNMILNKKII